MDVDGQRVFGSSENLTANEVLAVVRGQAICTHLAEK
jgi:hypothetical protein